MAMVTIRRPLYSGSGWRLYNGAGLALSQEVEVDSLEQAIYDLLTEVRAVMGGPGSTLAGLLELLAATLSILQDAVGVVNDGVQFIANDVLGALPGGYPGLVARIEDLRSATAHELPATAYNLGNIYDALSAPLNVGTLPDPPPEGYGGGASAEDVWNQLLTLDENTGLGNTETAAYVMRQLLNHHLWAGQYQGWVSKGNPLFRFFQQWTSGNYAAKYFKWNSSPPAPPNPDWTTWNGTDNVAAFLNTAAPGNGWSYTDPWGATSQLAWSPAISENVNFYWRCEVLPWMLPYLSGRAFAQLQEVPLTPPVWPGIDNVTLDDPYAISGDTEVELPMDGCLIALTTVPNRYSGWGLVGQMSRYRVGYISFRTDNGEWEPHQYLEFEQGLYCPKSMRQAASVVVHCSPGVEGTLTPYLKTT